MNNILSDLGLTTANSKLEALFRKVKPNKIPAKVLTREPGYIYQADLLQLPNDGGYNYCLTVCDTNNNICDAVAMKTKTADETYNGFKTIFSRAPLHYPKFSLETDQGPEFDNKKLIKYLNDKNIFIRLGARGRSNQQATVEYLQGIIATVLFMKMTNDELETGETSREWVDELPKVIKSINKNLKADKTADIERDVWDTMQDIVPIGTVVRVALDKPVNIVDDGKLHGKFRKTDHRWDIKERKIIDISIRPNQPIFYFVEGKPHNTFTRNQIQVKNEKETLPAARKYIVEKLEKKIYKGGRPYYVVKWKGNDERTEEPRAALIKDIPDMVKDFEANNSQKSIKSNKTKNT